VRSPRCARSPVALRRVGADAPSPHPVLCAPVRSQRVDEAACDRLTGHVKADRSRLTVPRDCVTRRRATSALSRRSWIHRTAACWLYCTAFPHESDLALDRTTRSMVVVGCNNFVIAGLQTPQLPCLMFTVSRIRSSLLLTPVRPRHAPPRAAGSRAPARASSGRA
jgi:hypothetical protein